MIAIVDFGAGNLNSVCKAVSSYTSDFKIVSSPLDLLNAGKIVLPGVGHFCNAMEVLNRKGLIDMLNKKVLEEKTPILGICLGLQLFTKYSEEGNCNGLGWIDAETVRFRLNDIRYKVPHIGWNSIKMLRISPLLNGISDENQYYFVHSYHLVCNSPLDITSTTEYGYEFVSSIQKDNIFGTQFHPEKSHASGKQVIWNFVQM